MMSANTIIAETYPGVDAFIEDKLIASAAITPGEILEPGGSDDVQAHSTANGTWEPRYVAVEDFPTARIASGKQIDQDYAQGDRVQIAIARPGEVFNIFIAANETLSFGDLMESDGAGALQALGTAGDAGEDQPIVGSIAEKSVSNIGGTRARREVRIR